MRELIASASRKSVVKGRFTRKIHALRDRKRDRKRAGLRFVNAFAWLIKEGFSRTCLAIIMEFAEDVISFYTDLLPCEEEELS